ncbi:hypothetical protein D3C72_1978410 [compost metagenome]
MPALSRISSRSRASALRQTVPISVVRGSAVSATWMITRMRASGRYTGRAIAAMRTDSPRYSAS